MKDRTVEVTFELGPTGAIEARISGGPRARASEPGFAPESLMFTADFALLLAREVERRLALGDVRVFVSFAETLLRSSLAMAITSSLEAHGIDRRRFALFLWRTPPKGNAVETVSRARSLRGDARAKRLWLQNDIDRGDPTGNDDDDLGPMGFATSGEPDEPSEQPDRRADIALLRTEPGDRRWLSKDTCLRQGALYRLRVNIGERHPGSLMLTPPPPIDPLLPSPTGAGYELSVMVNGEDFTLEGAAAARLFLPQQGASTPVDFLVRAPAHEGAARLYIAIAHRGNVLQSFALHAEIDAEEAAFPDETRLSVRLLFCNTARFSNLTEIRPRALSIGVGNPRPGAATPLHLTSPTSSVTLRLAELMTPQQVATYRRILEEATSSGGKEPRFLAHPSPQNPQRPGAEDVLRELAILGSDIYRGFYLQADAVQPALDALVSTEDRTIQIIRHNPTQTFPWAALYDFPVPDEIQGHPTPVCLGEVPASDPDRPPTRCGCPRRDRWCARGFWGVRHQIEELIGTSALVDAVLTVERKGEGPIGLALGTRDKPALGLLVKVSQLVAPAPAIEIDLDKDLLETLWSPRRPPILIVLGHMATADAEGEPRGPRIVLQPGQRWLQDRKVIDFRHARGRWSAPRSLVMVLACTAGAAQPATVADFMLAFHNAGAGAVIGTECTVFSGLLARFAAEVTGALLQGSSLGAALTGFRRLLLRERNPLGFVFDAIGNADLTLAAP